MPDRPLVMTAQALPLVRPSIEAALRPLRLLYSRTRIAEFGPRKLKLVREEMIKLG